MVECLQGHVPYPDIIQHLLVDSLSTPTAAASASAESAGTTTTIQEEPAMTQGHIPPFWDDLLQFPQERKNSQQGNAEVNINQINPNNCDMVNNAPCAQECLLATWRTKVVCMIVLNQTSPCNSNNNINIVASDPRQSNSSRTTMAVGVVHLVLTFLQLAMHRGHLTWKSSTDCMHQALDAMIMLNGQLIHTMLKKVHHHPTAATIMSSSDRSMMPLRVAD